MAWTSDVLTGGDVSHWSERAQQNKLFGDDNPLKVGNKERAYTTQSVRLFKSAVQKAVRRGNVHAALTCMKAFALSDPSGAARRLAVIVLEDAILHPKYDALIALMRKMARRHAVLSGSDLNLLLTIVADCAKIETRDEWPEAHPLTGKMPSRPVFSPAEFALLAAIKQRALSGGMPGDVKMLHGYNQIWHTRFADEGWTAESVAELYPVHIVRHETVAWPVPDDVPDQAVDFHCTPVGEFMLQHREVYEAIREEYPDKQPMLVLRGAMWVNWSGVNHKVQRHIGATQHWWRDHPSYHEKWGADGEEKLARIWATMAALAETFSREWRQRWV